MTAIDRTAYPRFKSSLTTKELNQFYTPTAEEIALARANARGQRPLLSFLVLLKAFQRLGYFPNLREVPRAIKNHIRDCLVLPADQSELPTRYPPRSLYRYHTAIRHYLKVNPFNPTAEQLITNLIETLARQRNNPADLINASLELLLKEHYELPVK
jgi:hypothetical protein